GSLMKTLTALVFDDFETLDLFGPVEIFGRLSEHFRIQFASLNGNMTYNQHGVSLPTVAVADLNYKTDILLVVGGLGTRPLVSNEVFLQALITLANSAEWVLSVCTGSALLA